MISHAAFSCEAQVTNFTFKGFCNVSFHFANKILTFFKELLKLFTGLVVHKRDCPVSHKTDFKFCWKIIIIEKFNFENMNAKQF